MEVYVHVALGDRHIGGGIDVVTEDVSRRYPESSPGFACGAEGAGGGLTSP